MLQLTIKHSAEKMRFACFIFKVDCKHILIIFNTYFLNISTKYFVTRLQYKGKQFLHLEDNTEHFYIVEIVAFLWKKWLRELCTI